MKTKLSALSFSSVLMIILLVMVNTCQAQDQTIKDLQSQSSKQVKKGKIDSSKVWNTGGQFDLNLAQGSQSNWAAGGDDFSFSINSYFGLYAFYKKDRYSWDNTIDLN